MNFLQKTIKTNQKRNIFRRIFFFGLRCALFFFVFTFLWVLLLKWINPPFTHTMFSRSWTSQEGKVYQDWVSYEEISDHLKVAVVASEDQRFPRHSGFDWASIKLAIEENKIRRKQGLRPRGASTISQQVAKNVFLWQGGGYFRKGLEAYFTVLIEWIWGKERILEVYLNVAEMGPQTFGVQASAVRYFKKNAKNLTASECATLAAVLPNPNVFLVQYPSPYVLKRRGQILYQMKLMGGIHYLKDL